LPYPVGESSIIGKPELTVFSHKKAYLMPSINPVGKVGYMPFNIQKSPVLKLVLIVNKYKGIDINISKTPSYLTLSVARAKARGLIISGATTPIKFGPLTLFNYL